MIADIARCLFVMALTIVAIAPCGGASAEPPAATLEVSGNVVDETEQPIAGASVDAFPATALAGPDHGRGGPAGAPLASALSGSDGQFRLMVPAANAVVLRVRAPGKAEAVVRPDVTHWTTVRLDTGLALAGRVVDGAGQAIAGIDITAVPDADDVLALAGAPVGQAISDENGAFRIADLAPGLYAITAKGERWSSATKPHVRVFQGSSDHPELQVEPGVVLAGRVLWKNEGVGGAAVCFVEDCTDMGSKSGCVRTDENGRFRLGGLALTESSKVLAGHDPSGHANGIPLSPFPLPSEHDRENMVLELAPPPRPARVVARLVAPDGNPFRGHVRISAADTAELDVSDGRCDAELDVSDGCCDAEFDWGDAPLLIQADGYLMKSFEGLRLKAGSETDLGTIHLERGILVSGIVAAAAGHPIGDAEVEVRCWDSVSRAKTGADGRFVASGMVRPPDADEHDPAAAPCSVDAGAPGFAKNRVECHPGASVTVTLEPYGAISGRAVTGLPRRPVPGLRVSVDAGIPNDFAAADGRFVLEEIPAGTYMLHVCSDGYREGLLDSITVNPGERIDVGDVVLAPGTVLTGTVFDRSTKTFVAGATVTLDRFTDASQDATTDVAGTFRLSGLVPGRHTLVVHLAEQDSAEVDVDVPAEGATIQIEPDPPGSVEGTVLDSSGQPGAGWTVSLSASHATPVNFVTDQHGHYRSEPLPPGRYWVSAFLAGADARRAAADRWPDQAVIVAPGKRSTVDFPVKRNVRLSGTLRRNGEPVSGSLAMHRINDPIDEEVVTGCDQEGHFTIELPAPGRYNVALTKYVPGLEAQVGPDDQAVMFLDVSAGVGPLALEWPSGTVEGSVAGPGGRPPETAWVGLARTLDPRDPVPGHCSIAATGRFLCKQIADGEYWVSAHAPGFATRRAGPVRVSDGKAEVAPRLLLDQPLRSVKLHVLDENGATTHAVALDGNGEMEPRDGGARVDPSDPVLVLVAPHFAPTIVRVPPEALLDDDKRVDVVVERGRPLEVTVTADGRPAEGALLRVEDAPGHDLTSVLGTLGETRHLVSDAAGRIKLKRVARGTYVLHATLGDRHAKTTVTMGNEANSATLDLR